MAGAGHGAWLARGIRRSCKNGVPDPTGLNRRRGRSEQRRDECCARCGLGGGRLPVLQGLQWGVDEIAAATLALSWGSRAGSANMALADIGSRLIAAAVI